MAAARISNPTKRGFVWWHTSMPHSSDPYASPIVRLAAVFILRMYSQWMGEALRRALCVRSSGAPSSRAGSMQSGTGM